MAAGHVPRGAPLSVAWGRAIARARAPRSSGIRRDHRSPSRTRTRAVQELEPSHAAMPLMPRITAPLKPLARMLPPAPRPWLVPAHAPSCTPPAPPTPATVTHLHASATRLLGALSDAGHHIFTSQHTPTAHEAEPHPSPLVHGCQRAQARTAPLQPSPRPRATPARATLAIAFTLTFAHLTPARARTRRAPRRRARHRRARRLRPRRRRPRRHRDAIGPPHALAPPARSPSPRVLEVYWGCTGSVSERCPRLGPRISPALVSQVHNEASIASVLGSRIIVHTRSRSRHRPPRSAFCARRRPRPRRDARRFPGPRARDLNEILR